MRGPAGRNGRWLGGVRLSRRNRRLLVRVALCAAVAFMIWSRHTSPKSVYKPVWEKPTEATR